MRRPSPAPLVWVHGWLGDGGGRRVLRGLGRRVVPVSLPGYGAERGTERVGLERAIRSTVAAAKEKPGSILVGHSMGGLVAVRCALEPESRPRGLVLLAPVPPAGIYLEPRAWDLFRSAAGDPVLLGKVVDYLTAKRLPPRWVQGVVKETRRGVSPAVLTAYLEGWVRADPDPGPARPLEIPTLLVLGRYDRAITSELSAREIAPWLPNGESVVLDECGHFPLAEVPLRTLRLIEDFLARIEGAGDQ